MSVSVCTYHYLYVHHVITLLSLFSLPVPSPLRALRREMMFGDADGFLCVYVGRISNEKRLDIVIDVMRRLSGPRRAYLAIVGDGPSAPVYAQFHGPEHGVYCRPRFLSHAELAEVYASSDVHVSASEFETLGNTVLEAFSCGIPVVVPRTQGFRDTVRHQQDGFLFTPGDREDATRCLQALKDDEALRVRLGAAGQATVHTRTIEYVVRDLLQWYGRGADKRARRSALFRAACTAALLALVPFTIFLFCLYNFTVSRIQTTLYIAFYHFCCIFILHVLHFELTFLTSSIFASFAGQCGFEALHHLRCLCTHCAFF